MGVSYLASAAPADTWSRNEVTLEQDNEWQYAGLLLHVDDDNYSKVTFTKHSNDSRFFESSETGGARTTHGDQRHRAGGTGNTVLAALRRDGTAVTRTTRSTEARPTAARRRRAAEGGRHDRPRRRG